MVEQEQGGGLVQAVQVSARALLDHAPSAFLRRVGDRETFASELDGVACVVKRVLEPRGIRARLFASRSSAESSSGAREHEALVALAADGVAVPRAMAWTAREERGGVRSVVAMERVEHTETLRERLARAARDERDRWSERLFALVTRLHGAGWHHRDLYLHHVVLRDDGLVLLDVGRARKEPRGERWLVKDLAALLHSTPRAVTTNERLRFLARWLDARGVVDRRARRSFLARVVAKERRMAAHVPRAGEDRPWSDR